MLNGTINYALCQENVAMVGKMEPLNIDASVLAFSLYSYAWTVNSHSDSLRKVINTWLGAYKSDRALNSKDISLF